MSVPENDALAKLREAATPGPWLIMRISETGVTSDAGRSVASCGGYQDNYSDGAYVLENTSNARLIALAPDLVVEVIALRERVKAADAMARAIEKAKFSTDALESALAAYRATQAPS